jgi:predicted AlkP superfamily pyrophosphatase or phosphodiesterase
MGKTTTLLILLMAALVLPWSTRGARSTTPVVLISIDGLKPDYVLQADKHGLKIPNLRRLAGEGMYATGVAGVLPTVTYPSHTTMVTGVWPSRHGILANEPFDPFGKNLGGWYWYAEDIKVPTLWDAASGAGLVTSSVDWPATVGAKITHNIVQYWRSETAEDVKIIRALSTPGLLNEAERAAGSYPDGNDYTVSADTRRGAFNAYVLEKKKPRFHLCYLSGLDTEQHGSGPYSTKTFAALEEIDKVVGQVRSAAEKTNHGEAVTCVVSDHGFALSDHEVNVNAALREAGLIDLDEKGKVKSWRAFGWYAGGSVAIMLRDSADSESREKVRVLLNRLVGDPNSGVDRALEGSQARSIGGFPDAAFVVGVRPGFRFGRSLVAPVTASVKSAGTHGYFPDVAEMESAFFIGGFGIPKGRNLGRIDMRDIAPTLAALLELPLPTADGRNLLEPVSGRGRVNSQ